MTSTPFHSVFKSLTRSFLANLILPSLRADWLGCAPSLILCLFLRLRSRMLATVLFSRSLARSHGVHHIRKSTAPPAKREGQQRLLVFCSHIRRDGPPDFSKDCHAPGTVPSGWLVHLLTTTRSCACRNTPHDLPAGLARQWERFESTTGLERTPPDSATTSVSIHSVSDRQSLRC